MAQSLYSHVDQPLDVSCTGKGCDLGQGSFLQLRQSLKSLTIEGRLLTTLSEAGATSPSLKIWHITVSTVLPHGGYNSQCLKELICFVVSNILHLQTMLLEGFWK